MKMDGKIRIATDAKFKELYNNLKTIGVVEDFHELFFVCACLGYRKGKSMPFHKRDDRFWSSTITPIEWSCYYAMVLESNNFDYSSVADDKEVLVFIEKFANGGIHLLIDEFLSDFLLTKGNEPQIDPTCSQELAKHFVHFLFEQTEPVILEN